MVLLDLSVEDDTTAGAPHNVELVPFGFTAGKVTVTPLSEYGGNWTTEYLNTPEAYCGPLPFPELKRKAMKGPVSTVIPTALYVGYGTLLRQAFVVDIE